MIKLSNAALPLDGGCVLTIGNFDGVHLGHQALMKKTADIAADMGLPSAVWTFSEHPQSLLKRTDIKYCVGAEDKALLVESMGIDIYYAAPFADYMDMPAAVFAEKELVRRFGVRHVVCGYDFRFGKGGEGDSNTLSSVLAKHGVGCTVLPAVTVGGTPVSSTRLRALIKEGDMQGLHALLGRLYGFTLPVIHGRHLATDLGSPTINQLFPKDRVLPAFGVYAALCLLDGKAYKGVANIGVKPTVTNGDCLPLCETHIFDFEGDLYGKEVRVLLYKRLREERRFESLAALSAQIAQDAAAARAVLDGADALLKGDLQ